MKFSFTGRHMDIGEALTNRSKEACEALSEKYSTEFLDMNIVMKKDSYLFACDISCKTATGNSYRVSSSAEDPNICFDVTLQKLEQQMQHKKNSRCSCKKSFPEMTEMDNSLSTEAPTIIAEILDDLPLLSVSEAAQSLDKTTKVRVFENVSNKSVNVVYIRDDGNIGWIDYKVKR